ncbi:cyanophycinase [Noviherbaspirillum sp. L7-7A]|uniref:cyanophycinase n=1 Tax=Noviherbaspirillum sp. L7-7A TaxID=2850560 RepID=UPI001C2B9C8A|nr:cyanophycinase [Noviherbaspirillum sp. L7-7A]MBV0881690.1 cyanophycinase [Noviherbaspirillum sp. L7-7A]
MTTRSGLLRTCRRLAGQGIMTAGLALLLATQPAAIAGTRKPASTASYSYFATGNPDAAVSAPSTLNAPSFVLMGGGPDVDEAFRWMIDRAGITPKTGGRFVVIRATGTEAYNPYIYYSNDASSTSSPPAELWVGGAALGLSSVETLVIPSIEAANDETVNAIVGRANAVFIAGGDQADYIRYWKGTRLDGTLKSLMAKNIPLGGTSAGLAVLGQFDYAALNGTVTSKQALSNPYNKYMTLDPAPPAPTGGFIAPPALANLITDSHLDSRDRMGRLFAFVARLVRPDGSTGCSGGILPAGGGTGTARGIGIAVETALLVQGDRAGVTARRVTNPSTSTESAVYFVRPLNPPTACLDGKPLTMTTVEVQKLTDSGTVFNLGEWSGLKPRTFDAVSGELTASPY